MILLFNKRKNLQKLKLLTSDMAEKFLQMNIVLSILTYQNQEVRQYMKRFLLVMDHQRGGTWEEGIGDVIVMHEAMSQKEFGLSNVKQATKT